MKLVRAAVGVLQNAAGETLIQQRTPSQVCAGDWEFPGGKIGDAESPPQALRRELMEELGIEVLSLHPWLTRRHGYAHAEVVLHFFRVRHWRGVVHGREGQKWRWTLHPPDNLLPANTLIWKWLSLPPICAITAAQLTGVDNAVAALATALARGVRLVLLRDKTLPLDSRRHMAREMRDMCRRRALLLINDDDNLARETDADGVHLSSRRLAQSDTRPPFKWVGASCHNESEVRQAAMLGADFALLSPINFTPGHAGAKPLGWEKFQQIAREAGLPLYALGGMTPPDSAQACARHGQGVAMMRNIWR